MDIEKLITESKVKLLMKNPFFGYLVNSLSVKGKKMPFPVGTDGRSIYYDEELLEEIGITLEEMEGILVHEVMHLILEHSERLGTRNKFKWNMATDLAVNSMLRKWRFQLPEGSLFEEKYVGMSADQIYDELPDKGQHSCPECGCEDVRIKKLKVRGRGEGNRILKTEGVFECLDCGHTWEGGIDIVFSEGGMSGVPFDDHDMWGDSDIDSQELRSKVAEAADRTKMHGEMPARLERIVDDLVHPRVDWRRLLERYVQAQDREEYTWKRPNRHHLHRDIYLPSLRSDRLDIAIAVDTSGSISEQRLNEFMSEIAGILNSVDNFKAELIACDSEVHAHRTARCMDDFKVFQEECQGGGGTDFVPVFEELDGQNIDCLVYLTDGMGSYPEKKPRYDVVWVLNRELPERYEVPFGRKVVMGR